MRFSIRFRIGNRFGAASKYSLRAFCLCVVDRYGITESALCAVFALQPGERWETEDMMIQRVDGVES